MQVTRNGSVWLGALEIPLPAALSPQARAWLCEAGSRPDGTRNLTADADTVRSIVDAGYAQQARRFLALHPGVSVEPVTLAGVRCWQVTPPDSPLRREDAVLINLHGGAFVAGRGAVFEAIPIAARTGLTVIAVDYRLAPEHPFPAAVEDALAVYQGLMQLHSASRIALYGSSAGAVLGAQTLVAADLAGVPLPAALGFFSGTADFTLACDSEAYLGIFGFSPDVRPVAQQAGGYLRDWPRTDPRLSPQLADLRAFPPTLCMTGTRDFFLGGTCRFHRALRQASVAAELFVFEGLPHVHWKMADLPETGQALDIQAEFLLRHLPPLEGNATSREGESR
ncbi:MAG: alpha/beta hydrolase fold domain-containing protein [Burkholderiales bacterium]|nr:alpha/beta hydrolase fold domain-containing protein [Burkholderiales bacterium]